MYLNPILPKLLGICFYHSPRNENVKLIIPVLSEFIEIFPWSDKKNIEILIQDLDGIYLDDLQYDYSVLFEGQGVMPAPPWGSYYLEVDQLLMGESTVAFRGFLHNHKIQLATEHKEPEDQFGLMLITLSLLLEKNYVESAKELLNKFLLPWAFQYLNLVKNSQLEQTFYPILAKLAETYLRELQDQI